MKIDIVIPNYNGAALVDKNLPILIKEAEKYKIEKIIIIDDSSRDDDYKKLSSIIERERNKTKINLLLLRNEKNLGFSSTVNNGAAQSTADFVVLLNTDVIVEHNFLDAALKRIVSDDNIFGVGMMDMSVEGDEVVLRGRGLAYWSRGFLVHTRGEVDKSDTFWISGGSSIIRRELFKKLGGFDMLYNPFYWEDIDLSYRARKAGYEIMFEEKSVVEHRHSEGAIKKHYKNNAIKTIAYRNQFIFVWKNISDIGLILNHLLWLPYHLGRALLVFDLPLLAGFYKAFVRLPYILSKRRKQALLYKIKDKSIIS